MSRLILSAACLMMLALGLSANAGAVTPELPDTRILIDISGSMKKNDPKNLRRPALRLLVSLLPSDSRAGVWTFGQYVNMQVPLGKVDKKWRARARKGTSKIHSRGLYTNIEEALVTSAEGWVGTEGAYQRHVVLLTDGMVDVSKDPADSRHSRAKILETLLPRLQDMKVQIHTVALSKRADHELMRRLSETSGGWYEQVETAAQLQKVFLRIFEKVGNPDTVPLKDNKFKVDKSIREVTLIVFRAEGAQATKLTSPTGESFDQNSAPDNVNWHQDEGYDLLTIQKPTPGNWSIQAQLDPDNRVMILTDLKMKVSELPNYIVAGQRIPSDVSFLEQGKLISKREFSDMMHVSAEQMGPSGLETEPKPLKDDGNGDDPLAYDGKFEFRFRPEGENGRGELLVLAEGTTFQREKRLIFELRQPAAATLDADGDTLKLTVTATPEVIDPESMEASAELGLADGSHQSLTLERRADQSFSGVIDPAEVVGNAELTVRIRAQALDGSTVGTVLPAMQVKGKLEPPKPAAKEEGDAEEPAPVEEEPAEEVANDDSIMLIAFGAANLLLVLLGGGGFWWWRRRSKKDAFQLVEEDDEPPADDAKENAKGEAA